MYSFDSLNLGKLSDCRSFSDFRTVTGSRPRFLEPSVSRTSRYFEPILVSLGFASLKLYNFTPGFSKPRILETSDNSNQFWLPWGKLTLDNSNLRKFPNHLVRMSITFTPLNKLDTSSTRNVSQIIDQSFSVAKRQQVSTIFFN